MAFPATERVTFGKNPLAEVLSQLRFSKLLEIEVELPVRFQKAVIKDYPIFRAGRIIGLQLSEEGDRPPEAKETRSFEFLSRDEKWRVVLSSDFLALTTSEYRTWEEFSARLETLIGVLLDCYGIARFERIGLRYRNVIDRQTLNLEGVPWSELLNPSVAGVLAAADFGENEVTGAGGTFVVNLGEMAQVRVEHGLAGDPSSQVYVIDADFFIETPTEASKDAATEALSNFRPVTNDLFQWCISERLYHAMGPVPAGT